MQNLRAILYKVTDGVTQLNAAFFNYVFGDLDRRIAVVEERTQPINGSVQITGDSQSAEVVFADLGYDDQTDLDYIILQGARAGQGTPPDVVILPASNVTLQGFTINISAAPGLGNSIIVHWKIER